jgi:hypothetical protein
MTDQRSARVAAIALSAAVFAAAQGLPSGNTGGVPRMADGKPNLEGIWQAETTAGSDLQDHVAALNLLAGRSVLAGGGSIPYLPSAAKLRAENFKNRLTADPLNKCYLPGVPRVMYLEYPFQILQRPDAVTLAFEWELEYRLIYTDASKHKDPDDTAWMGDSRGHWDGDTLVVDVSNFNDKTWLDMAGDFHSEALHVIERYKMTDHDTIHYEAVLEDPKVFSKAFTIAFDLKRRTDRTRLYEYVCQAENEEVSGAFTREDRTWYPGSSKAPAMTLQPSTYVPAPAARVEGLKRTPEGKPDLQGFYESNAPGANQGLEQRGGGRGGRRLIVDPEDGKLPLQPWAAEEKVSRQLTERGYDDPTAHCFPAGVPRSLWVPEGYQIVQTKDYIGFLHERVAWRIVPLDGRPHLPDNMRLWQGDSVGHWEGDTLVIDTANFNGKMWLSEGGDVVSYAAHVVERFTPATATTLDYEATVTDPVAYAKPWTVAFPIRREKFELREAACHEEDRDLPHLKILKDAAASKQKGQ